MNSPLAHKIRPKSFDDFSKSALLIKKYPFLARENCPSLLIYGPPGTGKTTLGQILLENYGNKYTFSAVLQQTAELRALIKKIQNFPPLLRKKTAVFIDEAHRLHKAQQDALLPLIEKGEITLIGATTELPRIWANKALLSRIQVIECVKYQVTEIEIILKRAEEEFGEILPKNVRTFLAESSNGDARRAIGLLEALPTLWFSTEIDSQNQNELEQYVLNQSREFDRNSHRHYDVISAFIKSMRGSDPDAALLWLAVMLEGGEDPLFIARRLIIFASEDVGNADPRALTLAVNTYTAIEKIGLPEGRISLGQTTSYLASTLKSNRAYKAIDKAISYVKSRPTIDVPEHLRSGERKKGTYLYPHDYPEGYVPQKYMPEKQKFYEPSSIGQENFLKTRLDSLKGNKQ